MAASIAACGLVIPDEVAPRLSAPPEHAAAEPWPNIAVTVTELARPDGIENQRLVSVAHGPAGFVAVGYVEEGPVRDGIAWFSPGGKAWSAVDPAPFEGVELEDVAAGPSGFVAIGTRGGDASRALTSRALLYTSADGGTWTPVSDDAGAGEWYAGGLSAGPGGYLAWGAFHPDDTFAWFSRDAVTWDRRLLRDVSLPDAGWHVVVPDGQGWLAGGSVGGHPAVFRSADGSAWETEVLPTTRSSHGGSVERLAVGRVARIAGGADAAPCSPMASCAGTGVRWWSDGRGEWGLMPDPGDAEPGPWDPLASAGKRGLVSASGRSVWASPDGWAWTVLADPGRDDLLVTDAVVAGDRLVAVGEVAEPNGRTVGMILSGRPAVEGRR